MKNELNDYNVTEDPKTMKISVETYSTVRPKFTKSNWNGGEGDDNA